MCSRRWWWGYRLGHASVVGLGPRGQPEALQVSRRRHHAAWTAAAQCLPTDRGNYCKTSDIGRTLVGNNIVDYTDGVVLWRCSNYIFILDSTHGFNGLGEANCKTRRTTFKFWDLVRLMLEVWWYTCTRKMTHHWGSFLMYFFCCMAWQNLS